MDSCRRESDRWTAHAHDDQSPVFGELARVGNLFLVVSILTLFFGHHAVNQH